MNLKQLGVAVPAAPTVIGSGVANAEQTINEAGAIAFVVDKWDEKEPEKGHKLVDMAARTVAIPDDPAAPKYTEDCVGRRYMPDESSKRSGTCTYTFKSGTRCTIVGRRVASQGISVQDHRWHRQIRRRQWRRYLFLRKPDGHALKLHSQAPIGSPLK